MKFATLALAASLLAVPGLMAKEHGAAKAAKAEAVSKTFKVGADAKVLSADKDAKLADIKVGDKVVINYKDDNGTLTASKVRIAGEKPAAGAKHEGGRHEGQAKDPVESLHAIGTVTAVDTTAGTLTVDVVNATGHAKKK